MSPIEGKKFVSEGELDEAKSEKDAKWEALEAQKRELWDKIVSLSDAFRVRAEQLNKVSLGKPLSGELLVSKVFAEFVTMKGNKQIARYVCPVFEAPKDRPPLNKGVMLAADGTMYGFRFSSERERTRSGCYVSVLSWPVEGKCYYLFPGLYSLTRKASKEENLRTGYVEYRSEDDKGKEGYGLRGGRRLIFRVVEVYPDQSPAEKELEALRTIKESLFKALESTKELVDGQVPQVPIG